MDKSALRARLGQGPVWAMGCMSGTSLDGVDAALIKTDGDVITGFGPSVFHAYTDAQRQTLRRALGKWQEAPEIPAAAEIVEKVHQSAISNLLQNDPAPSLVGFHGQTFAHDPQGRGTHQAGDGQALAQSLGLPVVWDFRSADVKLGGEGAPLAPFFHHACARFIKADAPVVFLNLGGVGNVTWVDPSRFAPDDAGACLAFDTGPANAPLDDLMQDRRGKPRDEGGQLALSGRSDKAIVDQFLNHAYFHRMPPKSLDRNDFPDLPKMVEGLSDVDALRTLTACAAAAVARGLEHCPVPPARVLVTGGGRHNAALMAELRAQLSVPVEDIDTTGLNGDMLEAQAFAYLAVRVARGLTTSSPSTTGVAAAVGGGSISIPLEG
ncbi:anhydro-N-acetylmuramic acid kinase [Aliiroseovarius sp. Z3]|uniref:anhydro-N-acetylmuramic acid kinase n=1 Tax=Aliiroseovarius sp. Z3 TaxID=2811402 RepID=UPI0023B2F110|nr:anhydro-N-acetylmuramic acid kinase [Aliiroseovarius sp. Z3]MDE9450738.1 anhydro-N-acetylmuramic acid kinase [Aliiroseovarius sp. Z3]